MSIRSSHLLSHHVSYTLIVCIASLMPTVLAQTTSIDPSETLIEFTMDASSILDSVFLSTDVFTDIPESFSMNMSTVTSEGVSETFSFATAETTIPMTSSISVVMSTPLELTPSMEATTSSTPVVVTSITMDTTSSIPPEVTTSFVVIAPSSPAMPSPPATATTTAQSVLVTMPSNSVTPTAPTSNAPSAPPSDPTSGLSTGIIIAIAAGGGVALVVVVVLIFCCMCCCCLCGSSRSQEYATGNDNRPIVVVRTFGQDFHRSGSLISRGSRNSIASSIRSSIRRLSSRRRSKTKDGRMYREENVAMKVTPL